VGEVVEMMIDGTLCEVCGVYLGQAIGFPRRCRDCKQGAPKSRKMQRITTRQCPQCGRIVSGLADHIRDSHGVKK
jgi:Zn finger protein HypA/HybF involved in hydrogenase expression